MARLSIKLNYIQSKGKDNQPERHKIKDQYSRQTAGSWFITNEIFMENGDKESENLPVALPGPCAKIRQKWLVSDELEW